MSIQFDPNAIEKEIKAERKASKSKSTMFAIRIGIIIAMVAVLFGTYLILDSRDGQVTIGSDDYETTVDTTRLLVNISNPNNPVVVLIMEDGAEIAIELFPEYAPITVANFIQLVEGRFYDGLTFHRIIDNFMMQGGCPVGNGTGNSDHRITGEFINNGTTNPLQHMRGAVSMARMGTDFNSATSQFFIVQRDSHILNNDYAVFGFVIYGMDSVDSIINASEPLDSNGTILFADQPVIRIAAVIN